MKNIALPRANSFPNWKGFFAKRSKQDVTKVVPLCKNGRKHEGGPYKLGQEKKICKKFCRKSGKSQRNGMA